MSSVSTYRSFAVNVRRLDRTLAALEPQAAEVGVTRPAGQEWFELLHNKLLPQLDLPPLLVVAIVGGTNIGKSAIFNHLAGEVASTPARWPPAPSTPFALCRRTWPIRSCSGGCSSPSPSPRGDRPTIPWAIPRRTGCIGTGVHDAVAAAAAGRAGRGF